MTPSEYIKSFIKGFESLRLKAYMPTPKDVPTIGWGHTRGVKMGDTCTVAEAEAFFTSDLNSVAIPVWNAVMLCVTQNQYDAMVSLAYNIGMGNPTKGVEGFLTSSVLRYHLAGNYNKAADSFALWNKQAGKVLNGLVKRRAAEADIYRTGKYQ